MTMVMAMAMIIMITAMMPAKAALVRALTPKLSPTSLQLARASSAS